MKTTTFARFRAEMASMLDGVNDDREPLLVTRGGKRSAVVLSADEYAAIEETLHLLRSPANARRLHDAMAELDAGGGSQRTLDEPA